MPHHTVIKETHLRQGSNVYCLFLYKNFNLPLAFFSNDWAISLTKFDNDWAISLTDKVWSNVAPKYFTDVVDLIAKLLQVISRLGLLGEQKTMDSLKTDIWISKNGS